MVNIQYDFQGPSLHRVEEIKIPNWLTFKLLLFLTDLSAGLAKPAAATEGQEERGDCGT